MVNASATWGTDARNGSLDLSLTDAADTARPRAGLCFTNLLHRWAFISEIETAGLWSFRGDEITLDVGSGAGELCLALAQRVAQVVALDAMIAPTDAIRMWRKGGRGNIVHRKGDFLSLTSGLCDPREREEFDLIVSYLGLHYLDLTHLKYVLRDVLRRGGRFLALCPRIWFTDAEALAPTERKIRDYIALVPFTANVFAVELECSQLRMIESPPLKLPPAPVWSVLEASGLTKPLTPTDQIRLLEALGTSLNETLPTTVLVLEKV